MDIPYTKGAILFNGELYGTACNAGDLGEDIRILQNGQIETNSGTSPKTECN